MIADPFFDDDKRSSCQKEEVMRDVFMCLVSSGSVFVKEIEFFRSQGGFVEDWGQDWKPVVAASVEDARRVACETLPGARLYERQTKP
jgi:hypothetical protein